MAVKVYDCIIIGAGPAGLGAAIYAARDRFNTLVLEKFYPGGQIGRTDRIENYPGFSEISGPDLVMNLYNQAQNFGPEMKMNSEVTSLKRLDDGNIEICCDDEVYVGKCVILAPGSSYRALGVPGEEEFRSAGAGVSYCGTCDAPFFRGKKVIAVGGGNTAVEEALHLAKFVDEITLIHRRDEFRATKILQEELNTKLSETGSNLKIKYNTVVTAIQGEGKVQKALLKDVKTGEIEDFACDGVFIFVGMNPNTEFLKGFVPLTQAGFIKC